MNNFTFRNPTKLIFGKGTIAQIAAEIPVEAKIMMTYGGGSIRRNGVYDQVKAALKDRTVVEFGGIEPNPQYETLVQAIGLAREQGVDFLLAVGGGSVIDGTKFIATALKYEGDPWDFMVDPSKATDAVPLATVLTLPATGSEMNNGAVVSRKEFNEKLAFHNPKGYPLFSVLDPEVCYSLPQRQIVNGIVDSFAHTLEQYLTFDTQSMVMDRWAEGLLLTLVELGPKLVERHNRYDEVANFMLTATMALNGFIAMGVPQDWATHMIGHELTALHGLDHGVTLAIVYPGMMKVMRREKFDKLVQYAERVWGVTGSPEQKAEAAIGKTDAFFRSLGVKTRLSEHGIGEQTVDFIVERFRKRGWNLGESGKVTPERVAEILHDRM
ncbi:iron-containing alcohol dehydrogenase [Rikenella microfusus]|uniref:iron-containing alcohol dehydrogenase n=1 Tax=Rikenella microfusus TaxID=28139 RepID=UPI001D590BB4|nr:iron-containing alcohol dehydrogenase [Rikenella microfusus]HJE88059.1 iron-containing alcohol dehydrogenase [Rikenella microfusus]